MENSGSLPDICLFPSPVPFPLLLWRTGSGAGKLSACSPEIKNRPHEKFGDGKGFTPPLIRKRRE